MTEKLLIEKTNHFFNEGIRLKRISNIGGTNYINDYVNASINFNSAYELISNYLINNTPEIHFKTQIETLAYYYKYEFFECKYAIEYKQNLFDSAIVYAKKAKEQIENAIKVIDDNISKLNADKLEMFNVHLRNWELSLKTIKIREIEPLSKKARLENNFMVAIDSYKKIKRLQEEVYLYINKSEFEEIHKRTEEGNFFANNVNVSISLANLYSSKDSSKYYFEIIKELINAIKFSKKALKTNPEQDMYKNGLIEYEKELIKSLKDKKEIWIETLLKTNYNKQVINSMIKIDKKHYQKQIKKMKINESHSMSFKNLLWFVLLISFIAGGLVLIFKSGLSWWYLLLLGLFIIILFTVIGAFALKAENKIKEKTFIEIIKICFKNGLNSINKISNKN
jgi:hypothetical protein